MVQSTNRYESGPGANVSWAFKTAEYIQFLKNEYAVDFFNNLALQQLNYQAIVEVLGTVSPGISQQVTWNYNTLPNIPGNYQAFNAPEAITWGVDGSLVVNNYDMLLADRSDYILDRTSFPNTTDYYPAAGVLSSTPLKKGKFYFEIEILEDTNYYFMVAPLGWESENLGETGFRSVAAIGARYWQRSTGRGHFTGNRYGASLGDSSNVYPEHSSYPRERDYLGDFVYNNPFVSGDILQFAYDTDAGVAFLGMNGIYARWNANSSYTTMDATDVTTGIQINASGSNTYAVYAVPFRYSSSGTHMTDESANANVIILTGDACNYSPPIGYTDH